MSCGQCKFLRVLPDADGKVRIRKSRVYSCTTSLEHLHLPKSVRNYKPPVPGYVQPTEGEGCSYFVERGLVGQQNHE